MNDRSDRVFRESYRMDKADFNELHALVAAHPDIVAWNRTTRARNTSSEACLAMCIRHLAHNDGMEALQRQFGISKSQCHSALEVYLDALITVLRRHPKYTIAFPSSPTEIAAEAARWGRDPKGRYNFSAFDRCLGSTDGTLIPVAMRLPTTTVDAPDDTAAREYRRVRVYSHEPYRCRKGLFVSFHFLCVRLAHNGLFSSQALPL